MFKEEISPSLDKGQLTLKEYNDKQAEIILSDANKEAARAYLGHEPNHNELAEYFISSGQAKKFAEENMWRIRAAA